MLEKGLMIFEPNDVYYRNSTPSNANLWSLCIYAFPIGGIPPIQFEGEQPTMLCQLHPIAGGVPGAATGTVYTMGSQNVYNGGVQILRSF